MALNSECQREPTAHGKFTRAMTPDHSESPAVEIDLKPLRDTLELIVAPLLACDSASVEFLGFKDGVVELRAKGTLRGCPGRRWTAQGVILPALRRVVEGVREVRIS